MKKIFLVACSTVVLSCGAASDPTLSFGAGGSASSEVSVWGTLKRVNELGADENLILNTGAVTAAQKAKYKGLIQQVKETGESELSEARMVCLVSNLDYVKDNGFSVGTMEHAFDTLLSDDFIATMNPVQLALLPLFLIKMPQECEEFSPLKVLFDMRPAGWLATYRAALANANAFMERVFYLRHTFNSSAPFVELSEEGAATYLDIASGVVMTNVVAPALLPGLLLSVGRGFGLLWHKTPKYEHSFAAAVLDQYIMPVFKDVEPGTKKAELAAIVKERRKHIRQRADMHLFFEWLTSTYPDIILVTAKKWLQLATSFPREASEGSYAELWETFGVFHEKREKERRLV